MDNYSRNSEVQVGADVITNQKLDVGGMRRSTNYLFENYAPIPFANLKMFIGDLFDHYHQKIREIAIMRDGELVVGVGKLVDLLNITSKDILSKLFSKSVWTYEIPNLVVVAGLNDSMDKHFKASAYTAAWYVGVVSGTPTFAAGDTMASHAGWYEVIPYSDGTRPALTLGTIVTGSVDNSASKAVFNINATMVVGGGFVVTLPTKGQTSGTLYGGAAFTGGNRSVGNGDTLNVTITLTATAA